MVESFREQSIRNTKPLCVLISDVHYSLSTLELSDKAFRCAIDKAAELNVPLIDCGDLTNDKAILRAEVVNRLIETMTYANAKGIRPCLLVGNHSLVNEKSKEHALNFLKPYATVIDRPYRFPAMPLFCIPYQNNSDELRTLLSSYKGKDIVIMHQGFLGASMGDYVQDKTSIAPELVKDFTVISGHYHRHQTITTVTYIGSPYTMSFGEANDGPKGFLVLNSDGSYTREILHLRKHVVYEWNLQDPGEPTKNHGPDDLVWIKIHGIRSELDQVDKMHLGHKFVGHHNFKLDLIPYENNALSSIKPHTLTSSEILDRVIDELSETDERKKYLKELANDLISS